MTALLPYFLIIARAIELQKVSVSNMQNLKTINTLTANNKYSLLNRNNSTQPIQMQLFQKQKFFLIFSLTSETRLNFEHFPKKMTLVADVFPKLRTPKNVIKSISKKSRFRESFERQHRKSLQTLLKSERQHLYHIYWSLWKQLTYKKSLLVIDKILKMFINTLATNDKYSFLNRDNLRQPIQMQLS